MVCQNLSKFGGQYYFSSRDIMFLVCHKVMKDQKIKRSVY